VYNPQIVAKLFIDMDSMDIYSLASTIYAYRLYT